MSEQHDHGRRVSEDAFSPAADCCPSVLEDLPCGCQDVRYACGYTDREHDRVACDGAVTERTFEPEAEPPGWLAYSAEGNAEADPFTAPVPRLEAPRQPGWRGYSGYGDQRPLAAELSRIEDGEPG